MSLEQMDLVMGTAVWSFGGHCMELWGWSDDCFARFSSYMDIKMTHICFVFLHICIYMIYICHVKKCSATPGHASLLWRRS